MQLFSERIFLHSLFMLEYGNFISTNFDLDSIKNEIMTIAVCTQNTSQANAGICYRIWVVIVLL